MQLNRKDIDIGVIYRPPGTGLETFNDYKSMY